MRWPGAYIMCPGLLRALMPQLPYLRALQGAAKPTSKSLWAPFTPTDCHQGSHVCALPRGHAKTLQQRCPEPRARPSAPTQGRITPPFLSPAEAERGKAETGKWPPVG